MTFEKWLDTLVEEKGLNTDHVFEVDGESGTNYIPLAVVLEHINIAGRQEKAHIKTKLVMVDFINGNVMHFFRHLAQAIAIW